MSDLAVTIRECSECGEWVDIEEIDTSDVMYECGSCGELFSKSGNGSHKCPSCNRFASRRDDLWVCPGCGSGSETLDDADRLRCTECDEVFDIGEDHECKES